MKADTFGLSDPFCIVRWRGAELGRTPVITHTLDPVWSPAPDAVAAGTFAALAPTAKDATAAAKVDGKKKETTAAAAVAAAAPPPRAAAAAATTAMTAFALAVPRTDAPLECVIEVWDSDGAGGLLGDFLGEASDMYCF